MYTCSLCHGEFSYLILEYDATVCEGCSIKKNISNSEEMDAVSCHWMTEEAAWKKPHSLGDDDARQLLDIIEKIQNPQIREDFREFAEQYIDSL